MATSISKQMHRILALYRILPRQPADAKTIEELKPIARHIYKEDLTEDALDKAIFRDLIFISQMLASGRLIKRGGKGRMPFNYLLSKEASIEQISTEMALVMVMAREYLEPNLPIEILEKVYGYFTFAESLLESNTQLKDWRQRMRFVPDGYGRMRRSIQDETTQEVVYDALLKDDVWLQAKYRREGQQVSKDYTLKPHGIVQYGQIPYLMASKIVGNQSVLRTFNLLRFDHVELIPERITVDIDKYDLEALVNDREFEDAYFNREEHYISVIIPEALRDELQHNPIGRSQSMEQIEDGFYILNAECVITTSRMKWFVENGHQIQINHPQCLADEVRIKIRHVAEYQEVLDDDFDLEGLDF